MSLFTKNTKQPIDYSHINIHLKSFLGFTPHQYLKVIFITVATVLFFLIALLPGLLNHGSMATINTLPQGAAVYLNDIRIGSSPMKTFIPEGNHILEYVKPHYGTQSQNITVKGRYFLSWFFPKKIKLSTPLKITTLETMLQESFLESSKWFLIPVQTAFPRPTLLRDVANDLVSQWASLSAEELSLILRWAEEIYGLASDNQSFSEIVSVWDILGKHGLPIDLSYVTAIDFKARAVTFDQLMVELGTDKLTDGTITINNEPSRAPLIVNGTTFFYAKGGSYVMGNSEEFNRKADYEYYPHTVKLKGFYYMASPVKEQIIASLNETNNFLDNAPYSRKAIADQNAKYITLAKALTYVKEVNQQLDRMGITDVVARIISESEWEYLARQNLLDIDGYEWTRDNYYSHRYILYSDRSNLFSPFQSAMNVIRGYHKDINILMETNQRGSQITTVASPYTGFRVILAIKENGTLS